MGETDRQTDRHTLTHTHTHTQIYDFFPVGESRLYWYLVCIFLSTCISTVLSRVNQKKKRYANDMCKVSSLRRRVPLFVVDLLICISCDFEYCRSKQSDRTVRIRHGS